MTLLVTTKVAIFYARWKCRGTRSNTYESWKIRFVKTPAGVHLAVAFINPSFNPRFTVNYSYMYVCRALSKRVLLQTFQADSYFLLIKPASRKTTVRNTDKEHRSM